LYFTNEIASSVVWYWTVHLSCGIPSFIDKWSGYDKWWITRYSPTFFFGTRPKGDICKFPYKDFLIKDFKFGFSIPYFGHRKFSYSKNLKSANDNPSILKEKIVKDILPLSFSEQDLKGIFVNLEIEK
jgi:hypothetical protein